jgi:hypothetical protein
MCHPQGAFFVTSLNYLSTITAVAKINKAFKTLKLPNVVKWLILHACPVRTGQTQQQHQHTYCVYGHQTDFLQQ